MSALCQKIKNNFNLDNLTLCDFDLPDKKIFLRRPAMSPNSDENNLFSYWWFPYETI